MGTRLTQELTPSPEPACCILVWVSSCHYNMTTNLLAYNTTSLFALTSGGQSPKSRCWQGAFFRRPQDRICSLAFSNFWRSPALHCWWPLSSSCPTCHLPAASLSSCVQLQVSSPSEPPSQRDLNGHMYTRDEGSLLASHL